MTRKSLISIQHATRLQLWLLLLALLVLGGLSFWTVALTRINGDLYEDISTSKQLVTDVLPPPLYIVEPYLSVTRLALADADSRGELIAKLNAQIGDYRAKLAEWRELSLPTELRQELFEHSVPPAEAFIDLVEREVIPAAQTDDRQALHALMPRLEALFANHRESITRLVSDSERHARQVEQEANQTVFRQFALLVLVSLAVGISALWISRRIGKQITERVDLAVSVADKVAKGHLSQPPEPEALDRGDEIGAILQALDEMRESLARHLAQLEQQKAELARQSDALARSKIQVENAERLKSEFLGNMSHELRTPLNGILGMLQLLKLSDLDSEHAAFVDTAERSAQSLFGLIEDMLFYANLRAGPQSQDGTPFNLEETIGIALNKIASATKAKQLTVDLRIDPTLPRIVIGQVIYFQRALDALLDNAVKFTAVGGISIAARSAGKATEQGRIVLEFEIADTGPGLPPERLGKLFTLFEQDDASHTRRHGGTGLGLALSKALSDAMGGTLSAENRPAGGACFTLRLPFDVDHA